MIIETGALSSEILLIFADYPQFKVLKVMMIHESLSAK